MRRTVRIVHTYSDRYKNKVHAAVSENLRFVRGLKTIRWYIKTRLKGEENSRSDDFKRSRCEGYGLFRWSRGIPAFETDLVVTGCRERVTKHVNRGQTIKVKIGIECHAVPHLQIA